jgi:hypothetical protein
MRCLPRLPSSRAVEVGRPARHTREKGLGEAGKVAKPHDQVQEGAHGLWGDAISRPCTAMKGGSPARRARVRMVPSAGRARGLSRRPMELPGYTHEVERMICGLCGAGGAPNCSPPRMRSGASGPWNEPAGISHLCRLKSAPLAAPGKHLRRAPCCLPCAGCASAALTKGVGGWPLESKAAVRGRPRGQGVIPSCWWW